MTDNEHESEDYIDTRAEADMFEDALLNGDEKINRLVKLVNTRFESNTRRVNKLRREAADRDAALRKDLGPLIIVGKIIPMFGGLGTLATFLYLAHAYGFF